MPHRCAGCRKVYENYAIEIAQGCPCGSKMFLYQKPYVPTAAAERPKTIQRKSETGSDRALPGPAAIENIELVEKVKSAIEDVKRGKKTKNIEFDMETIRMIEDGVYDIDITKLMKGEPLIVELGEDGKYRIHVASIFKKRLEGELEKEYLEDKKK